MIKPSFGKDFLIYGAGLVFARGLNFFLIPILTRVFSPSEYGVLEMFATISGMLAIFMIIGLDSAQSFYFTEARSKGENSEKITASVFYLRIILGLVTSIIVAVAAPLIITFAFDTEVPKKYLYIVIFSTFFGALVSQCLDIFRLLYKAVHYVSISLFQSLLSIAFILIFIFLFEMQLEGYFAGVAVANCTAFIIAFVSTARYFKFKDVETDIWKDLLRFGFPMVPAALLLWVTQASDRWFIMKILGLQDLGVFAVAAKFSLAVGFLVEVFRRSFLPYAMDAMHAENGAEYFRKISIQYFLIGSFASVVLAFAAPFLVDVIADEKYYSGWKVVGIYCLGSFFNGFYIISGIGIYKSKKTYLHILIFGTAAVLNIILNYLLIPIFGITGAAIATSSSILISNILAMLITRKYFDIQWNWSLLSAIILASLVLIFLSLLLYE